jgi:hypothetical protein
LVLGALALAALSDAVAELGDSGDGLGDLKRRMDAAVKLVAEIQAADGAARYLAGRLTTEKGAAAGVGAAQPASGRHPLDQKASDFLDRIVYLEAAADDCVVILERLKEASEALIADSPAAIKPSEVSLDSQKGLAAAAEKIKAILDKTEDDIAVHAGKNTDILHLLEHATHPTVSHEPKDDLEAGSYAGLNFASPDLGPDDAAFIGDLSALLSKIEGLYAMGQERDVHRAFSKACGLEVADGPAAIDDGLF